LGLVGARTVEQKKGADAGIDGRLLFHEKPGGKTRQVILSVKAGRLHLSHIRDLRGVVEREEAELGVLISMQTPTPKMRAEAAAAGFHTSGTEGTGSWGKHPRLQLLTISDLLDGGSIDMPPTTGHLGLRRAERTPVRADTPSLFGPDEPLSGKRRAARRRKRTPKLREDRQVSMEPDPVDPTDSER
jgi:hypothetical protein